MMKQYLIWSKLAFSLSTLFIFSTCIFNYKIDSLGLFGNTNYLLKAAKVLTNGHMIAGLKDNDERLFQELIIKNLKVKNEVVLIGSSRSMEIRKRFFLEDKTTFFNHSVSGASLEDYIAIIGIYEAIRGYLPKTIILGIDPWIFNKYNGQRRWKTLGKYYDYEIQKIYNNNIANESIVNVTKWKQLINYDYTIANIKFLQNILKNKHQFYMTDKINIDDIVKETDGSIHYPFKRRFIGKEEVLKSAIQYTKEPVYSLEKFTRLDNISLFESLIQYLQQKKIKIIFFLPPYNPISYDILSQEKKYKIIDNIENYIRDFAAKKQIIIKGSYNPHKYKFKVNDFFDGMHGHEIVPKVIFQE